MPIHQNMDMDTEDLSEGTKILSFHPSRGDSTKRKKRERYQAMLDKMAVLIKKDISSYISTYSADITSELKSIAVNLAGVSNRITRLEERLDDGMDHKYQAKPKDFDGAGQGLDFFYHNVSTLSAKIDNIEAAAGAEFARMHDVQMDLDRKSGKEAKRVEILQLEVNEVQTQLLKFYEDVSPTTEPYGKEMTPKKNVLCTGLKATATIDATPLSFQPGHTHVASKRPAEVYAEPLISKFSRANGGVWNFTNQKRENVKTWLTMFPVTEDCRMRSAISIFADYVEYAIPGTDVAGAYVEYKSDDRSVLFIGYWLEEDARMLMAKWNTSARPGIEAIEITLAYQPPMVGTLAS